MCECTFADVCFYLNFKCKYFVYIFLQCPCGGIQHCGICSKLNRFASLHKTGNKKTESDAEGDRDIERGNDLDRYNSMTLTKSIRKDELEKKNYHIQ